MSSGALTPTSREQAFSGWLDLFRALAAFAVLYGHGRALFLASATGTETLPVKILYLLSGYGHQAVMVFFVLSGYLVGGTVIRATRNGRWSWGDYLLRRGTRLYIVLIPALLLTLCWDSGEAAQSTGLTPNNDTAVANITSGTIQEHTSWAIFAGNVAFLQEVVVPPLGSNTPLWSLANEFWYYVFFPLLWIAASNSRVRLHTRVLYLAVVILGLYLLGPAIALYFSIWLLGVVVALAGEWGVLQKRQLRRFAILLAGGAFLASLLLVSTRLRGWHIFNQDLLIALTFATLLYCLKHDHRPPKWVAVQKGSHFFADFSYTLYLVHLPLLIFLRACLTYEAAWQPTASSCVLLAAILAGVLLYAYLISLVTERQTETFRRWLGKQFRRQEQRQRQLVPAEVAS